MEAVEVAIIGGGCAGTLVAAQVLAGDSARPLTVALIERRMPPGRGVAYGTPVPTHLLNLPVREMSAWPDDPEHFSRWLAARPLYTLGWPRIGQLWEATTVPSLRAQAEGIGRKVLLDEKS